ncbi:MAG: hypothetical protein HQ554_02965 [FCB group bacterium]|nr:hypothetical protein [FCB group bacterium]
MANIYVILGVVIPIVSLVLSIIVNLYPKQSKKIIEKISKTCKKWSSHVFSFSQSINYTNIFVGIIIIAVVFLSNDNSTLINQDSAIHIGTSQICPNDESNCYYPIQKGQMVYFQVKLKADSSNKMVIVYANENKQNLEIGLGGAGSQYTYITQEIDRTYGNFEEKQIFEGKKDINLCSDCFINSVDKFFSSVFSTTKYIAIKANEDIKIRSIYFLSEGMFNIHRIIAVLIGVLYIILGFVSLFKLKK